MLKGAKMEIHLLPFPAWVSEPLHSSDWDECVGVP